MGGQFRSHLHAQARCGPGPGLGRAQDALNSSREGRERHSSPSSSPTQGQEARGETHGHADACLPGQQLQRDALKLCS